MKNKEVYLPEEVKYIISKLDEKSFEAYAVGGCIRDSILGKIPKDWDITTSAKPEEIMNAFKGNKIIPTGLQHGTVTVMIEKKAYEVTTYRIDGEYADGRRPENVTFTKNLKDDLNRRDFTINAMAYNDKEGIIDCFEGKNDLKRGIIRCVGDTDMRFSEDYLRMLRAYRFATVLGFELEESIVKSCKKNRSKILSISAERIRMEFDKIIVSNNFKMIKLFLENFSEILFPEIYELKGITQNNKYHYLDVYNHTFEVLKNTSMEVDMRLTALFHDIGKKDTKTIDKDGVDHFYGHQKISADKALNILKRLKYDNKTMNCVVDLIKTHDDRIKPEKKLVRRLIHKLGEEKAYKNLKFQQADVMGQSLFSQRENLPVLEKCLELYYEVIVEKDVCTIQDLAVSGGDIIELLNIKQGMLIGEVLKALLEKVMDNPKLNTKENLRDIIRSEYCLNNKK